jgi:probable O-glycosylation ligase (exosortase A-associated)
VAWRIAFDYPFGVGFDAARSQLFGAYSRYPEMGVVVAHSIYFQMMGEHGFIGLFLFMAIGASTWLTANRLRKIGRQHQPLKWAADLGAMVQVSMVGYATTGAFLSLTYYDLPYNVMVMAMVGQRLVLAHVNNLASQPVATASATAAATQTGAGDKPQPPRSGPGQGRLGGV